MSVTGVGLDDYVALCEAVRRACGIDLSQYKRPQMERRIRSFVRARAGHEDLAEYAKGLTGEELDAFLNRVTINVSQLWRNPEQWQTLERLIIPDLVAGAGRLRCWSAGCSYGAEAFTLAATACRAAPGVTAQILGTDIDVRVIERARRGHFTAEDARDAPPHALADHFTRTEHGWQAKPELMRTVRFEQGDLLRLRPQAAAFDLVLCRNTVIYFTEEVRDALHGRLASAIRSGGRLVVGATERVADPRAHGLISESPFVYRKI